MSNRIEDLEPQTQAMCLAFLQDCEAAGVQPMPRITHTRRTMDEQLHLWAQGRRMENGKWIVVAKSKTVTNAPPGFSAHNYGAAFDVCFSGPDPYLDQYGKTHKDEKGHPLPDPRWLQIGKIGEALGLNWGGPNGKGDRFTFDRPHFERKDWRTLRDG